MTVNCLISFEKTYKNEGGYIADLGDGAGETNGGITKRTYPHLDIKSLTKDEIFEIYKRDFWDHYNIGSLNNQGLCDQVFDMSINSAPLALGMTLQLAIHACGNNLTLDGIIGSATITAANSLDPVLLLKQFRLERIRFYTGLANANPDKREKFLRSWNMRALS